MKNKRKYIILLCPYLIIIAIISVEMNSDIINKKYSNLNFYSQVGSWIFFCDDIIKTIQDIVPANKSKMQRNIESFKESRQILPYNFEEHEDIENIILIQLEGIDAVSLELQYNGQDIMPNLNLLKRNYTYFENAFDQTGSGRTSDGEFLALTSLLPITNESMYLNYELGSIVSLPKILDAHNYQTVSIHGFEGSFYNRLNVHKELGYQKSYFLEDFKEEAIDSDYIGWGLSDKFILNKVYNLIKEADRKTFIHAILLSNHHPFDAVSETYDDLLIKNPQNIVEMYLNSINYTDLMIGELIENLQLLNIMDRTLIVIFSDHDSGITSEIYDYFNMEYDDSESWRYDKIPLIFCGQTNAHCEDLVVGQAEIMPMILSYLNIEIPDTCMGLNYINGKKVVYKQMHNIYAEGIDASLLSMDLITKSIILYSE